MELLIVMGIAVILLVIALPMMTSQRRLMRFNEPPEFLTQLRYARQLAMSERQAITFQYDDSTKPSTSSITTTIPPLPRARHGGVGRCELSNHLAAQIVNTVSLCKVAS